MTPFGEEIRKLRASRNATLKQHAADVGVTPAYLSALEHGHRGSPTSEMTDRIISALNLQPAECQSLQRLLQFSHPKVSVDTSGLSPLATEVANRLAGRISNMSEIELRSILDFVRGATCGPVNQGS